MIERIVTELGPWNWMVLGLLLLVAEVLLPGIFFLWIGMAAVAVGLISLMIWGPGELLWTWEVQVIAFAVLSFVSVWVGRRYMARADDSDQPLLNKRAEQMIGRTATLAEAVENGYGRVRIGDSTWRVRGEDAPVGAKVRIVEVRGSELVVEPA